MDAVNAEQLPAPVKKEKRHIEATLYAPGPAKYASSSQSSCIHEIVGSHSMHTSSDGIIANNEEQYTQDDSPSGVLASTIIPAGIPVAYMPRFPKVPCNADQPFLSMVSYLDRRLVR